MPFKKGQSGNPSGGRVQKLGFEAISMEIAQDPKRMRRIARKLLTEAEKGNMVAIKEVFDRLDGKPQQSIDATVNDGTSLTDLTITDLYARMEELRERSGLEAGETAKPSELH